MLRIARIISGWGMARGAGPYGTDDFCTPELLVVAMAVTDAEVHGDLPRHIRKLSANSRNFFAIHCVGALDAKWGPLLDYS